MADTGAGNLAHLANLVFDRGATLWYRAIGLEVLAAIAAGILAFANPSGQAALITSAAVVGVLVVAYIVRLAAEDKNDTAQTMRRQAALSDGLGWPIEPTQAEEWRRKAGSDIRKRAAAQPREADYYATTEPAGPRRMAAMTLESSFYTRHQWLIVRNWLVVALAVVVGLLVIIVLLALSEPQGAVAGVLIAHVVATAALVAIAVDAVGWSIRLTRQASSVLEIEKRLDKVLAQSSIDTTDVVRLVSEYDCELINSFPIHRKIFERTHDEIRELWDHRNSGHS